MSDSAPPVLPQDSPDLHRWRLEVRAFVREHLPRELARKVELGLKLKKEDYVCWQKILFARGWFAGEWPQEFGGQG